MNFYLVQKLKELPPPEEPSSDVQAVLSELGTNGWGAVSLMETDVEPVIRANLGFEYMGASEFQFGAVPASANRIVSSMGNLAVVTNTLVRPTYEEPVHFVCTEEQADQVLPTWHEWSKSPFSKVRPSYFKDTDIDRDFVQDDDRTVAWWALDEDILWTRDEALAEKLAEGFNQRKAELLNQ